MLTLGVFLVGGYKQRVNMLSTGGMKSAVDK